MNTTYKKYLPSKHFIKVVLICFGIAAIIFLGVKLANRFNAKHNAKANPETIEEAKALLEELRLSGKILLRPQARDVEENPIPNPPGFWWEVRG